MYARPCDDEDPCTTDFCDELGDCTWEFPCDDYNPCTEDECTPGSDGESFSCDYTPRPGSCPNYDDDPCNDGECEAGACVPVPLTGPQCPGYEEDPCNDGQCQDGACVAVPTPGPCDDDGNECTNDLCDDGSCVHPPLDGAACQDDGDLCTDDICDNGVCTHLEKDCDDGDLCTNDSCNAGVCEHPPKCPAFKAAGGKLVQPVCCEGECCAAGYLCCEGMCCSEERCCTADLCCDQPCEECLDNGTLSGGSVTMSPMSAVCLGDTITFMAGGVVDSGGIKRIDCNVKTAVDPVSPSYAWRITKPDGTTVPPAGSEPGTGPAAGVVADMCGTYSCTFTASADRDCPPPPHDLAPATMDVSFDATLSADPTSIPARSPWQTILPYAGSRLTVTWDPVECDGVLEIVELVGDDGYVPPDEGMVEPRDPTVWLYRAFLEPQTELCPKPVNVKIAAMQGDSELDRVSVRVLPIHTWWTNGHKHGPGAPTHPPDTSDFWNDYGYLLWKYGGVLATTGGEFSSTVISTDTCVWCGVWPLQRCVAACTNPVTDSVEFGTSAFSGSENRAASIIGHELVHTIGAYTGECAAYTWEVDHAQETEISQCDVEYFQEVQQLQDEKCP